MSISRQTRVEMVPAEPADFVDIEVRPEEADDWLGVLQQPEFLDLLPKLKPVTFRRKDNGRPMAIMGLGLIETAMPGLALPWVWAALDRITVREWGGLRFALEIRANKPIIKRWLDDNARGFYTSPQILGEGSKPFTKVLAMVGFRDRGHGLWQWVCE
jgi:hypothetical protein